MASFLGWTLNGDMPMSQELQRPDTTPDPDGPQTGFLMYDDWNWASAGPFPHGPSSGPFDIGSPVTPMSSPNHPDLGLPIRGRGHHERHGAQTASNETEMTLPDASSMFVPTDDDCSFVFSSAATSYSDASASPLHNQSPAYSQHATFPQYGKVRGVPDTSLPSLNDPPTRTMSGLTPVIAHPHATRSAHETAVLSSAPTVHNESESVFQFELDALGSTHLQSELNTGERDSFEASEDAIGSDDEYYTEDQDEDADGEEVDEDEEQQGGGVPDATLNGRPHFVPDMAIFEDPVGNGLDMHTCFSGIDDVQRYLRAQNTCPPDNTLPRTQVQKQAIVNEMVKLMKTTEFALDNEPMLKPFKEGKHSHERMEAACWQLLETMIDRSLNGALLCAFNGFRRPREKYATFADRMSYIFECLGLHKTICKRLMDPPYLYTLVDDPIAADKRVRSNKNLNARKGTLIVAGKEALDGEQQQPEPHDEDDGHKKKPKTRTRTSQAQASRTRAAAPRTRTTRAQSRNTRASQNNTATASKAQVPRTSAPAMSPQQNAFPVAPMNSSSMEGHVDVNAHMNGYVTQHAPPAANDYHGQQDAVPFHTFPPMFPPGPPTSTMRMQTEQSPAVHHQPPMGVEGDMAPHIAFTGPAYEPAPMHGATPFSHPQGPVRRMTDPVPFSNTYPPYLNNHGTAYLRHSSTDNPYVAQAPMVPNIPLPHTQFGGVGTPVTPFTQLHVSPVMQNGQKRSSPDARGGRSGSPKRRR